jgi:predicted O-methyltransferase YrrM
VQTGETAFEHIFGMTNWQYRAEHPEANASFNEVMARDAQRRGRALVAVYDFPSGATVADIGGGVGTLLTTILAANTSLRGILVDRPHVVAEAPAKLQAAGVADRCEVQGGDFFDTLPASDVYTLSIVLHDWDDADALRILERCRKALRRGGALLLIEQVVPPGNAPHASKITDLNMLLINRGGRERTEAEWRALLERAGFVLRRILATSAPESVLEGRLQDQPA